MEAAWFLPIAFAVFAWWFGTGVVMYLNGMARHTHRWTMAASTVMLGVSLLALVVTRDDTSATGAYVAFSAAVLAWAWKEIAFLLGYITGPRRTACPPGATGWPRAAYALQALLHHELALLLLGVSVVALTWGGANATGLLTFLVLWAMRQSAKLNVFLGVRNLNEEFLPSHLRYLGSYFRHAPMNRLFPLSVLASTWVVVLMWQSAGAASTTPADYVSLALPATLLTLAILEHWFMVLPLPFQALWNWGLRSRTADPPA
jgi:putative photosynthetic complex assembly protein 2